MTEIVISEPLRTAVGRYGGVLKDVSAAERGCRRSGRVIALDAGLPISVPGVQVDRRCGSVLQAVLYAGCRSARAPATSWPPGAQSR